MERGGFDDRDTPKERRKTRVEVPVRNLWRRREVGVSVKELGLTERGKTSGEIFRGKEQIPGVLSGTGLPTDLPSEWEEVPGRSSRVQTGSPLEVSMTH